MSNATDAGSALRVIAPFIGYSVTGLPISVSNAVIVASILRFEALRSEKEFILLMALALGDAANMFNYFIAGIYRSWVFLSGQMSEQLTPAECIIIPHRFIWLFTHHVSSMMLVVISADRLYLVARPLSYLGLGASYAWRVVWLVYGSVGCMGVLGLVLALTADQDKYPQSPLCLGGPTQFGAQDSMLRSMYAYYNVSMPSMLALLSVILYVLVYPVYTCLARTAKVSPDNLSNNKKEELKRQRKLTKVLAISCLCTFCLYSVPFRLVYMFLGMGMPGVAQMLAILSNANPLANLVIYHFRIPELRTAIVSFFKGKDLPPVIRLWPSRVASHAPVM